MSPKTVYAIVHHEIYEAAPSIYQNDEALFHIASSFKFAVDYIKSHHVEPYSWWEILEYTIDAADKRTDPKALGYYGRRGGKLKRAPYKKAVAMYKKCKADPSHHLNIR